MLGFAAVIPGSLALKFIFEILRIAEITNFLHREYSLLDKSIY